MLRNKLFKGFLLIVLLFGVLSAVVGIRLLNQRVVQEAQQRVTMDLSSAWAIHGSKLRELEILLKLAASKEAVVDACRDGTWDDVEVFSRLERIRVTFGLDFLNVLSPEGQVMLRVSAPNSTGDYRLSDPAVASALRGEAKVCMAVMSAEELQREGGGLAERAFLELEATPRARKTDKQVESRGMVMVGAAPVRLGPQLLGVVCGGVLVNRNNDLVDRIRDVVFRHEQYQGVEVGTATIFLGDCRVATTVRLKNGNRALGTRVSKEVADRVLDNAEPWVGEAFVVRDTYLTAYDPIRDGNGLVIGMLYVGILKSPFSEMARGIMLRYLYVSLFVLVVGMGLAFYLADRLARPIHRLVEASNRMSNGSRPAAVSEECACHETSLLIRAFNQMTETLAEREERLKALNRSYMETLGFVSHELKSPVATIVNYSFLLREQKMGPLTDRQVKAVNAVDGAGQRLVEMVRHYLNLSRIENGHFQPTASCVAVWDDVLQSILDSSEAAAHEKGITLTSAVPADIRVHADVNMMREVFENLLSNAVKYGREGGTVSLGAGPAADGGWVEFFVRNDGEGIPRDRMPELFQKFSRLGNATGRQKGTGLGLFITKEIVEAHGGRIWAESEPGQWVEFRFTLPAEQQGKSG